MVTAAYDDLADWYEHEFLPRTDQGVRDKVGASHFPLPALFAAFTGAGLVAEELAEGGAPVPVVLALRARKLGGRTGGGL